MPTRLITPPASEPVTLVEAKAHLRLEHSLDDAYVTALITAARQWAEDYCWRGFLTQTWELVLDGFPCGDEIELPKGGVASVSSVTYADGNGTSQTLASSAYSVDVASSPGRVMLPFATVWPITRIQWDAVVIRYVVGASTAPAAVKQALLLLISQMYENRTPEVVAPAISRVEFAVEALLGPYRLRRF